MGYVKGWISSNGSKDQKARQINYPQKRRSEAFLERGNRPLLTIPHHPILKIRESQRPGSRLCF